MQIDLLAEISQSPRILSEVDSALKAKQMKNDVDEYLKVFYFSLFGCFQYDELVFSSLEIFFLGKNKNKEKEK